MEEQARALMALMPSMTMGESAALDEVRLTR